MKKFVTTALAAFLTILSLSACSALVTEDADKATTGTSPETSKQSTAVITVEAPDTQAP